MKTILYVTDYSMNSVAALKYAHEMATHMETRLVITHVFDKPNEMGAVGTDEPSPNLGQNAFRVHRSKLEGFCEEHLDSGYQDTLLQIEPAENKSVVKGIIEVATKWHAYLIVMGMKGGSAFREILMGSTTKQLIEQGPCPILSIPTGTSYRLPKTIVYATDFEEEDVYAIRKLAEMAEKFRALIKVVHISTEEEYKGEMQMEWFKEMLLQKVVYERMDFEVLFSNDIFESLRRYIGEEYADLIVMLEREKVGFVNKWFRQDLVKKMESYGKVPLLSMRGSNHQLFYFKSAL
ncbi:universal stress protein [Maribacter polysaccharolyticus]|uniref:universal stress protein n=1 Tax=Maribacter polysaccharolyticus TaxID=3020831 RepID=UPI00237F9BC2|nr:universal stress protein [Maribacter polysaccharolyticus]MDE3742557.1 universal stress protein [Maribacter polysaccharolyticus]